jgi:hypothetical protein
VQPGILFGILFAPALLRVESPVVQGSDAIRVELVPDWLQSRFMRGAALGRE